MNLHRTDPTNDLALPRRDFLKGSAAALAALGLASPAPSASAAPAASANADFDPRTREAPGLNKALKLSMMPKELSNAENFKLARRAGYDGIDIDTIPESVEAAKQQLEWARAADLTIHGYVFGGWKTPFSSPDPAIRQQGYEGMQLALRCAHAVAATTVLLVPANVTEEVRYVEAMERSQEFIRKLIPLAEELQVVIAIENVWNKFLLSPIEFAQYIDDFNSPFVRAYFDIGNVIIYGFSQDWIRTLGPRIIKLDVKDFRRKGYEWVNLGEGDVNWPEVVVALKEINYHGWMTAELKPGDEAYLTDVAQRMDALMKA